MLPIAGTWSQPSNCSGFGITASMSGKHWYIEAVRLPT